MLTDVILIVVGLILTVGTGLFVAAEFSLVSLDPATIDSKAEDGDARAAKVAKSLHHISIYLSACQVGITLTTILLGYVAQAPLQDFFTYLLGNTGLSRALAIGVAAAIAFIIVNLFSMLFGELVPKNLALSGPLRTASIVARPIHIFTVMFKPIIVGLNNSANWVLRRFGIEPADELSGARSASELSALVRHSAQQGTLDVSTARLLTRSIGIGSLTAVDVMTDRGRVEVLRSDATAQDVIDLARETGHSRFPVVESDLDDVLGLIHVRRAITIPYDRRSSVSVTSQSLLVPALRVPETMDLAPLLVQLREESLQMAVVVDEYGGAAGVVTLEDAVEEIVGEVADEHDVMPTRIRRLPHGGYLVPGIMRPDEILRECGLEVPHDGPWETLGGWIMAELGKIPDVGDEAHSQKVSARVESMDERRVDYVILRASDDEPTEQESRTASPEVK
ncbi:MAG: hemolysin family protein [Actinomycetaceae bacterium]|nr:hemolysin family protein [Arcanobacterium sp.]MDD7504995.1 hemolysin family protein [Actinomycetaceae bacterium]MDY6143348.1 hemolysin family protein [Arcanobacterium sp.]